MEASLPVTEKRKVLLIGDSLTQFSFSYEHRGWGGGLAGWYGRSADVINRGYSGYNSTWVRSVISRIFPASEVRSDIILATILLGSNDSVSVECPQHCPLAQYKENILALIAHLRTINPDMQILLITPPPINHELWAQRHDDQVSLYAAEIRSIGSACAIPVVDLWCPANRVNHSDLYDGLHFGAPASKKVLEGVQAAVRENFPSLVPEDTAAGLPNLSMHFPHWSVLGGMSSDAEVDAAIQSWSW